MSAIIKKYSPEEKTKWVKAINQLCEEKGINVKDACEAYAKVLNKERPELKLTGSKLRATYNFWKAIMEGKNYNKKTPQPKSSDLPPQPKLPNGHGLRQGTVIVRKGGYLIEGDPETVHKMLEKIKTL